MFPVARLPLPPPIGVLDVELGASFSANAGGGAFLNAYLQDMYFDVDAVSAARLAFAMFVVEAGPGRLMALQGLRLTGGAKLNASARAEVTAAADANLVVQANPRLLPLKWYIEGGLGLVGGLRGFANFFGDVRLLLEWSGLLPRIKVLDVDMSAAVGLAAVFGVNAHLATGVEIGASVLSTRRELARTDFAIGKEVSVDTAFGGGDKLTLASTPDGTIDVNIPAVVLSIQKVTKALMDVTTRSTHVAPDTQEGGENVPAGTDADPVLIYRGKRTLFYPPQIFVDDADHFGGQRFNRTGQKAISVPAGQPRREIGVQFWPYAGWKFKKRKGSARREQRAFRNALEFAGYRWEEKGHEADHVVDVALGGDQFDRFDNLWPLPGWLNALAGPYHGQQPVWYQPPGAQIPRLPMGLNDIPDGTTLKVREIITRRVLNRLVRSRLSAEPCRRGLDKPAPYRPRQSQPAPVEYRHEQHRPAVLHLRCHRPHRHRQRM